MKKALPKRTKTIVLIPTFNRRDLLMVALKQLLKSRKRSNFDVCVIDNGSSDETAKLVRSIENVRLRREPRNVFISKALNNAFFKLKLTRRYSYVVVMAHDVFIDSQTIQTLENFMSKHSDTAVSGPSHYDFTTKKLLNKGLTISPQTSLLVNYDANKKNSKINHFHSCFILRASAFESAGGFNAELFPMMYEEPDLGERLISMGYKVKSCIRAKIWHPIEPKNKSKQFKIRHERLFNTKQKAYLFFRNRIVYMSLYSSHFWFMIFFFLINPCITIYYLTKIELQFAHEAVAGFIDGTIFAFTQNKNYIKRRNRRLFAR